MRWQLDKLLDVDLALFDGGGAAGGAGGGAAGGGAGDGGGNMGGTQAGSVDTQQGNAGGAGKDTAKGSADAGRETEDGQGQGETPEAREARYRKLVRGEFRDLYTADTQRIIDQRFKETRGLQETLEAQRPLLDFLAARYQTQDPAALLAAIRADDSQWEAMADAAGKPVDQFRADFFAQRERAQLQAELDASRREAFARKQLETWSAEEAKVRETYPEFDLAEELRDKQVVSMLRLGVPMQMIYEAKHHRELMDKATAAAADERERAVAAAIQARGARPTENGAAAQVGTISTVDVAHMTREQRAEIAKRAARGERITFGP